MYAALITVSSNTCVSSGGINQKEKIKSVCKKPDHLIIIRSWTKKQTIILMYFEVIRYLNDA